MTPPRYWCNVCTLRHVPRCSHRPTWPLEPLLDAVRCLTHERTLDRLGRKSREVDVAAQSGLSDEQADRWAIRAGLHPAQVWGWEWVEAGLSVVDRQFMESGWRPAWEFGEQVNASEEHDAA